MHCIEKFCQFLHSILEVLESDTQIMGFDIGYLNNSRAILDIVTIVILSLKLVCPNFKQRDGIIP